MRNKKTIAWFSGEKKTNFPVILATPRIQYLLLNLNCPMEGPMEGDEKDNQAMETLYCKLQARRQEEEEKLDTNKLHIIVDKSNVVNQLLEMYREDDAVSTSKLIVSFEGEESSGEGLLRKPYSLFWESFISQNCDGSPFSRSEKEWVILGFCQQGRDRIGLRHVHPISIVSHQSSSYYALEHARKQDRTMVKAVPQRS